jgi:PAS domain S-box-containing protein
VPQGITLIRSHLLLLACALGCNADSLTTAGQVKRLTAEALESHPTVLLTGIVTQPVPEWSGFSLQDSTNGVYVAWTEAVAQLKAGQRVEVSGRAVSGNFAPGVKADRVRILGDGAMPRASKVSWQSLSTGACDNNYVEVEGVVRGTRMVGSPEWNWPALEVRLDLGGNLLRAYVRDPGELPERLVDALVRVRGVCTVFANSKGQFFGGVLAVPLRSDVEVVSPGPVDPFDAPLRPLSRLFGYTADSGFEHRTRVQGIATLEVPGGVYIQDGADGLLVQVATAPTIRPGDRVDAVGFPAAGAFSAILDDALVRVTGHGVQPPPVDVQADAVLHRISNAPAAPDGVLVRIEGTMLDWAASAQDETLTLEDGLTTFTVRLRSNPKARLLTSVQPGSRVIVTGVCVVRARDGGAPRTFEVLLRSPADVVTVSRAPFSRSAALRSAGVLCAAVLAGGIWLALLRRRVAHQTEIMRAQFDRESLLEQRYADLVENASDAVYVRDLEGRMLQVNRGCEELTGYSRQELVGMNVLDLLAPGERERAREHLSAPAAADAPAASEWRIHTKQGGELVVEVKQRFLSENGRLARVECIGRDVTARKQAHSDEVTERRRVEEQLQQSQKMESIGLLAGGVAHDFNNLLTVISGYAQMAMEDLPPGHRARDGIEEIAQASERATALTRQLLTFSRRQMSAPKILSLNDLVTNLEKMLGRLIGEDIELTLDLRARTGTVRADPSHIEQVIMNLVVNARDAMPKGGKLTIATADVAANGRDGSPPGDSVELTVKDTGMGIPEEVRLRIFEPFFTTKAKGKGTGLGLSMVYGIVKQSGGAVTVESELGRGSAFRVLLPAVAVESAPDAKLPSDGSSLSGSETILVAEDEPGVRRYVCGVLRMHGYTVLEAATGREALEVAERHAAAIDLLLSDVVMPEMGGVELAERFTEARPRVPVILMSGYADRPLPAEHAAALLGKPFAPPTLLACVRQTLGKRAGR